MNIRILSYWSVGCYAEGSPQIFRHNETMTGKMPK